MRRTSPWSMAGVRGRGKSEDEDRSAGKAGTLARGLYIRAKEVLCGLFLGTASKDLPRVARHNVSWSESRQRWATNTPCSAPTTSSQQGARGIVPSLGSLPSSTPAPGACPSYYQTRLFFGDFAGISVLRDSCLQVLPPPLRILGWGAVRSSLRGLFTSAEGPGFANAPLVQQRTASGSLMDRYSWDMCFPRTCPVSSRSREAWFGRAYPDQASTGGHGLTYLGPTPWRDP